MKAAKDVSKNSPNVRWWFLKFQMVENHEAIENRAKYGKTEDSTSHRQHSLVDDWISPSFAYYKISPLNDHDRDKECRVARELQCLSLGIGLKTKLMSLVNSTLSREQLCWSRVIDHDGTAVSLCVHNISLIDRKYTLRKWFKLTSFIR